jgi:hypothetical protein
VLLTRDDEPVLTDFGSVTVGEIAVGKRADALLLQEKAAQYSSMPYRAPGASTRSKVFGSFVEVSRDATLDAQNCTTLATTRTSRLAQTVRLSLSLSLSLSLRCRR